MPRADLFEPHHPVWNILRLTVVFIGLIVLMYLNSSKFDETEMKTVLELLALVAGFELIRRKISKSPEE